MYTQIPWSPNLLISSTDFMNYTKRINGISCQAFQVKEWYFLSIISEDCKYWNVLKLTKKPFGINRVFPTWWYGVVCRLQYLELHCINFVPSIRFWQIMYMRTYVLEIINFTDCRTWLFLASTLTKVVKSKLPPRSGSSLEAVEPHP